MMTMNELKNRIEWLNARLFILDTIDHWEDSTRMAYYDFQEERDRLLAEYIERKKLKIYNF